MGSVQCLLLIQKQDDRPKKKKMVLLCAVLSFHLGFITQLRHHHTLLSVQRITDSTYAQKYMNKPTDRTTESRSQRQYLIRHNKYFEQNSAARLSTRPQLPRGFRATKLRIHNFPESTEHVPAPQSRTLPLC